jgi:hypothetical protein
VHDAPSDDVTLAWIIGHLRERSFGIVMLLIAVIGLIPGTSSVIGILLAVPSIQMMLARNEPILPRRIAARRMSTQRLNRMINRAIPVLRYLERFVRPRWPTPFKTTKRVVGLVILLLGMTLLAPIPFSQYIPTFVIMLLAFAYLEEDGVLLLIAIIASLLSIAITAGAVWGAVEAGLLL